MVRQVEVCRVILALLCNNEYLVVRSELAEEVAMAVVVEPHHVRVIPNLSAAECRCALMTERYPEHIVLGQNVAHGLTSLDGYLAEIFLESQHLEPWSWLVSYLDGLCLAVRVSSEIDYLAASLALSQVILLVSRHSGDIESLNVVES